MIPWSRFFVNVNGWMKPVMRRGIIAAVWNVFVFFFIFGTVMVTECLSFWAQLQTGSFFFPTRGKQSRVFMTKTAITITSKFEGLTLLLCSIWNGEAPWHFRQTKAQAWPPGCTKHPIYQTPRKKLPPLLPPFRVRPVLFSLQASDSWQDTRQTTSETSLLMAGIKEYSSGNLYQAGLSDKVYH